MNKSICIIPARGGSKRIPRKNILPLNGKPLIGYSIEAAVQSGVFDRVIVSTEDEEIKSIAKTFNAEVDDRPKELAGDAVTKVQVIKEFLERPGMSDEYEYVTALLPTCPFRSSDDVKSAFRKLTSQNEIGYLIGVTEYDFPIEFALQKEGDLVKMDNPNGYQVTRSQNKTKKYHPNGAMYMATVESFLKIGTFFNETMLCYNMPALRSYDIDYPYQFEIAEIIAKRKFHEQIH